MKIVALVAVIFFALVINDAIAAETVIKKKHKKRRPMNPSTFSGSGEQIAEKNLPPMLLQELSRDNNRIPIIDPCLDVQCGAGMVCELDKEGEAQCVCIEMCPEETETRRKVCSNMNETWPSDCAVYQQRCWCRNKDEKCKAEKYSHIHIDYYGTCRDMPVCTEGEMADFPRRMRDWLFNVMRDLADRRELSPHFMEMQKDAESNITKRWTNAAVWKFCDLDGHPPDRYVSRHELFPIRAPLMALEHCIAPFLNSCDSDDDHKITIKEWAKCLELLEDDIENRCDELSSNSGESQE